MCGGKNVRYVFNGIRHIVHVTYCSGCKRMLVGKNAQKNFLPSPVSMEEFGVMLVSISSVVLGDTYWKEENRA